MKTASVALVALLATCLAVFLSACGEGGEREATDREITDEELSLMVLPPEYLSYVSDFAEPYADIQIEPASWSNDDVIEEDFDSDDEREDQDRFGRLNGYHQAYSSWIALQEQKGAFDVDTVVELFRDPQGASGYLRDGLADAEGQVGQEREDTILEQVQTFSIDNIADETIGLRMRLTTRAMEADELALYATAILFRRGRLLADAVIVRADDKDVSAEVEALARKLDERIQAVLRGDISPTPAARPTPSPIPTAGGAARYEVKVGFNTSVTQDDIDEASALLRAYDDDLEFVIMESWPPIGRALLATNVADFCQTVEAELKAESYVDDVSCGPA